MFYVYALTNPLKNDLPFYIGKGQGKRAWKHLTERQSPRSNRHKIHTISLIQESGMEVGVEILVGDLSEEEAYGLEEALIAHYGRVQDGGILTNIALSSRPPRYSDATLEKQRQWSNNISEANRRVWRDGTRELTDKVMEALSKGCQAPRSGRGPSKFPAWNKGLTAAEDQRIEACANKRKGGERSEEQKQKMRIAQNNEETRRKKSDALKGRPSPCRGRKASEETKRKQSAAISLSHSSPEYKAKMSGIMKGRKYPDRIVSEETRRKMSDAIKAAWERKRNELPNKSN